MKRTGWIGLTVVLLGAACGGGGVSVDELPDEISNKFCDSQVACGAFPDQQSCLDSSFFDIDIEQIKKDIDAGVLAYDEDAAQRCIDAYDFLSSCELIFNSDALDDLNEACNAVFTGTVAIGGTCTDSEQCVDNGVCEEESCPDACCEGTCAANPEEVRAEIGQSCAVNDCVSGAFCASENDTCEALVAVGGACADFDACVDGALCDIDFQTGMGTCGELANEGETCDPDMFFFQCIRVDNFCDPVDSTCKRSLDVGSACTADECVGYASCVSDVCTERPGLGDTCIVDSELSCLGSLDCMNGTCVAEDADGYCPLTP